jgi:DNA-binding CsgD family transcriptional regulator
MMPADDEAQSQVVPESGAGEPVRPLTRQEMHVLDYLGQGYTNEDIGRALNISVSTVSSHVQHILKKLQVRNRVEAVLYMRYLAAQSSIGSDGQAVGGGYESKQREGAFRSKGLSARDPLLFLSQLNHINWRIAAHGPLRIDYFGIAGDVSLAFYDATMKQLKVHIALYGKQPGEINVEVDDLLWKYILEVAEVETNGVFAAAGRYENVSSAGTEGKK